MQPINTLQSSLTNNQANISLDKAGKLQSKNLQDTRKAAEDFEAVFLSQVLQHMYTDLNADNAFGGGHAEDTYKSMMTDEYGRMMAKNGGIGLADELQKEMLRMQENLGIGR